MANLKSLKSRIKSVKSTQKMTKAMKMVAAAKLRRAKQMVEGSRPYAEKIAELISNLATNIASRNRLYDQYPLLTGHKLNNAKQDKTHLIIILSSDRGLCGGLNSSVVKCAKNYVNSLIEQQKQVKIICIGKKAYEQLKSSFGNKIIDGIFGVFKKNITYQIAEEIAKKIISLFEAREFDICTIIYSKFKSAIAYELTQKQLIPELVEFDSKNSPTIAPINYEPSKEEILYELLPKNLTIQIYNQLLENSASEQGARMAAMEAASNNATKMIKNLTLVYNRTRQANITKELIDIVSGANAV
jgi:F-type H+-transporting ATPase subunit gamma